MNVVSLFDGMSCGQIALERCGFEVEKYYAAEIDKYAIEITQKNYPNTIQLGDVTKWKEWDIDWKSIDLVSGGFPCQAWSVAGKQLGDRDPRGALFWTMLDIISHAQKHNPNVVFLMENVKMKKDFFDYITHNTREALGKFNVYLINSSVLSAQNRERYYWTNIKNVMPPEDKGLVLADILEDGLATSEMTTKDDKSFCLTSVYHKAIPKNSIEKKQRSMVLQTIKYPETIKECKTYWQYDSSLKGHKSQQDRIRKLDKPSNTLAVSKSTIPQIFVSNDVVTLNDNQKRKIAKINPSIDKSNCVTTAFGRGGSSSEYLTSVKKKTLARNVLIVREATKKGYTEIEDGDCFDATFINSKTRRGRNMKYKSNCLTAANFDYMRYEHPTYRKLTPIECERLQTVPDNYTEGVSNTQRYKMLGNGWTVDVIAHIYKHIRFGK